MKRVIILILSLYFESQAFVTINNRIEKNIIVKILNVGIETTIAKFSLQSNEGAKRNLYDDFGITWKLKMSFKIEEIKHEPMVCNIFKKWTYVFDIVSDGIYVTRGYDIEILGDLLVLKPEKIFSFNNQ
ncbi:MAG: hypothetical protein P4L22_01825 [Candidatus Babeliales bacterium]|nr:hypothetical protein [Candidatus Babeliales bacterium]